MKVKIFKTALLAFVTFLFISCSKNDDDSSTNFTYQGTWSGTYTGTQDNGTWTIYVSSLGGAAGTSTSNVFSNNSELNGNVNSEGELLLTIGTSNSAIFKGQMNQDGTASGDWVKVSLGMNGSWTGVKE